MVSASGCPSAEGGPFTLSDPTPPQAPVVSSNSPVCAGSTLTLSATSEANGIYTWTGPNGFTGTGANPSIPNITTAGAGVYSVTLTINQCTSPPGTTTVVVNPSAPAPDAVSPVEYCMNTVAEPLTATPTNGGTLSWYPEASGGTPLSKAPTPSTTVAGTVVYYVSQTSTSGCEGIRAPIEVITHPDAKALFTPASPFGCTPFVLSPEVINLQTYPDNNGDYNWFANGTPIGSGVSFPGFTIGKDNDSVTIKLVTTSGFGCKEDSASFRFFTYQLPQTAFTSDIHSGCGPLTVSFTNQTPQPERFQFRWIWGNGDTSTDINPSPVTFATNPNYGDTTYHVTLLGFTICDTITAETDILVKSKPKALFAPDQTTGCSPMKVRFENISRGTGTNYQWFFGDGSTATIGDSSAVAHTYTTGVTDTFYAKLVATNECGTDTSTVAIVVSPNKVKLNVVVNGNEVTGCAPHDVQFINRSAGASTFAWDFGDGNTVNTTRNIDTLPHTFVNGGIYKVFIFASNGCSDTTTTETITVFDKPASSFSAGPVNACIGDSILFTNSSENYTSLLWKFGDAETSTLTNPPHAYGTAGIYNALLIAQKQYPDGTVCRDTSAKEITIVDKLPGVFTASATESTCAPFTATFTNTTLPSTLTSWTFSDGTTDTGDVVTHTFVLPGTYTAAMQAKHPAGCVYEANQTITVRGPAGNMVYTGGFVCNDAPVKFEASTTGTDSVRWDFGDGFTATTTSRIVYHSYQRPGVFLPSAELIAGAGCRVTIQTGDTIKVDYITAGFRTVPDVVCGTTAVHFTDTSSSYFPLQQWQWKLGDNETSDQKNPVHSYTATHTYAVQLVTRSSSGCADTADIPLYVKVNDKPKAEITGPEITCSESITNYVAAVSAIDSVSLYRWTTSDNAAYNTPAISHSFTQPGNYRLQLIAGTEYGCYDTSSVTVSVRTTPAVSASSSQTICRGATVSLSASGTAATYTWREDSTLSCLSCQLPIAAPDQTTQYYVTGSSANGCSRTDSVLITVIQPPVLLVSSSDSICIGQSKQLSASGAAFYQWSPTSSLSNSSIQNPVATPAASTVYMVSGTDDHHCFTVTKDVLVGVGQYPTISLGKDTTLSTGTVYPLYSFTTEGPIESYKWLPADNLSCSNCAVPDATIKKPVCYSVEATNYFGCAGRDTVCIQVFCENSQVFIPNIFTPDGDGINDKLVVQGKGIAMIKSFRVFNRWGQVVFEKSGFVPNDASSGWDGRVNGLAAAPDVYVYTCDVVCENGTLYSYKGNVAIIK